VRSFRASATTKADELSNLLNRASTVVSKGLGILQRRTGLLTEEHSKDIVRAAAVVAIGDPDQVSTQ